MHDALRLVGEIRPLRNPVLLAAFTGFTDAHGGAVAAVRYLAEQWAAEPLATIDPERFYDFTVQRPRVHLEDGQRVMQWPQNSFLIASPPGADRDFVLFHGIEPHLRWRTFVDAFEDLLRALNCTTSVTLAAQPAAVPHTRPLPVTLSASDADFEETFGLQAPASRYQGPTGIVGVLNLHLRGLGWRNASLWALTPHYLTVGPNPNVAVSLIDRLDHAYGTNTSRVGLLEQSEAFEGQVQDALEETDEADTYVRQLEDQYDAERGGQTAPTARDADADADELPSPDELLNDLERFLRDQQRGGTSD